MVVQDHMEGVRLDPAGYVYAADQSARDARLAREARKKHRSPQTGKTLAGGSSALSLAGSAGMDSQSLPLAYAS